MEYKRLEKLQKEVQEILTEIQVHLTKLRGLQKAGAVPVDMSDSVKRLSVIKKRLTAIQAEIADMEQFFSNQ
jgi:hypothetical protein